MAQKTWTVLQLLQWTEKAFKEKGIESGRLEAELLLAKVLSFTRIQLYTHFEQPLGAAELQTYRTLIRRRFAREPLAYLLEEKEFYSLMFKVTPAVLIPRPETELLVAQALIFLERRAAILENRPLSILEVGTGSGCIAVSLAKQHLQSEIWSLDVSNAALKVAQTNAESHQVHHRIHFIEQDVRQLIQKNWPSDQLPQNFDLILSNPPYISTQDIPQLAPELHYEPLQALDGGENGLTIYPAIFQLAKQHLKLDGVLLLEIGQGQAEPLCRVAYEHGFPEVLRHKDFASIERVLEARIA